MRHPLAILEHVTGSHGSIISDTRREGIYLMPGIPREGHGLSMSAELVHPQIEGVRGLRTPIQGARDDFEGG